jgi:hypothetical protein
VPERQDESGQLAFEKHGRPLFAPPRQTSLLNAPFCVAPWPGQKTLQFPRPTPVQHAVGVPAPVHVALSWPDVFDLLAVPVVSGFRLTGIVPMYWAHTPLGQSTGPAGQSIPLFVPL